MQTDVHEIAPDLYRISTYVDGFGIQFNQFLLRDDEPFLMHTGMRRMFPATLKAVARIVDPATLRWIGYSHFEPDECGALNEWFGVAPQAAPVCSTVGAMVMLGDFSDRPARPMADNELLETGRHRLRFVSTPHLPHGWDAGLFFDEADKSLFCSDLLFQPGNSKPLSESDIVEPAVDAMRAALEGPMAKDMPYTRDTRRLLDRLAALEPRTLAVMHGASFHGDGGAALRQYADAVDAVLGTA
ncbi:MAG: MBL fold metallo-hydrolase [Dongiaceae bacterium]